MNNKGLNGLVKPNLQQSHIPKGFDKKALTPNFEKPRPFENKENPFDRLAKIEGREAKQVMNSKGQNLIHNKLRNFYK